MGKKKRKGGLERRGGVGQKETEHRDAISCKAKMNETWRL